MFTFRITRLFTVLLFTMILIMSPVVVFANSDIFIKIYDPDKGFDIDDKVNFDITCNVLSAAEVSFGDNRVLGTLRMKGKEGIVPVKAGQKVKIELPVGTCYMHVPTMDSYKNYITWPESLDGVSNQIRDGNNMPGIKFLEGTPRSLTVEIGNVDDNGGVMVLDFIFSKENYSSMRVSRLIEKVEGFEADPEGKITRLDFFKLFADVTMPFPSALLESGNADNNSIAIFSDPGNMSEGDMEKIRTLMNYGIIAGYPGKELRPNNFITRAEAANMIGKLFPSGKLENNFSDGLPDWAKDIHGAIGQGIVKGYPDGTLRPNKYLSKGEALNMLQKTLECYKVKI